MRIQLSDDRRAAILTALRVLYADDFDEYLSDFQGERLVEFFLSALGPPVYNQGVQDARAYIAERLDDIEGDVHEPEMPL